jgi:hypothetical protein
LFAIKIANKRLQSSEVLLGVVMQIKGFNFLQKHKETEFTFAKIKATQSLQITLNKDTKIKKKTSHTQCVRMHTHNACARTHTKTNKNLS